MVRTTLIADLFVSLCSGDVDYSCSSVIKHQITWLEVHISRSGRTDLKPADGPETRATCVVLSTSSETRTRSFGEGLRLPQKGHHKMGVHTSMCANCWSFVAHTRMTVTAAHPECGQTLG